MPRIVVVQRLSENLSLCCLVEREVAGGGRSHGVDSGQSLKEQRGSRAFPEMIGRADSVSGMRSRATDRICPRGAHVPTAWMVRPGKASD